MTRFEEACQSEYMMGVTVSFCIAAYLERIGVYKFNDEELKEFMHTTAEDIEEWLKGVEGKDSKYTKEQAND